MAPQLPKETPNTEAIETLAKGIEEQMLKKASVPLTDRDTAVISQLAHKTAEVLVSARKTKIEELSLRDLTNLNERYEAVIAGHSKSLDADKALLFQRYQSTTVTQIEKRTREVIAQTLDTPFENSADRDKAIEAAYDKLNAQGRGVLSPRDTNPLFKLENLAVSRQVTQAAAASAEYRDLADKVAAFAKMGESADDKERAKIRSAFEVGALTNGVKFENGAVQDAYQTVRAAREKLTQKIEEEIRRGPLVGELNSLTLTDKLIRSAVRDATEPAAETEHLPPPRLFEPSSRGDMPSLAGLGVRYTPHTLAAEPLKTVSGLPTQPGKITELM